MGERVLIVEDEATLRENIGRSLAKAGLGVTTVSSVAEAMSALERTTFDLVLTDLRLGDGDGLRVLDRVREAGADTMVVLMTAYASVDSVVEALRRGAHDYILKPLSLAELQRKVRHLLDYRRLGRENARLRAEIDAEGDAISLLRRGGAAMGALSDAIEKVASSSSNVLVVGESGVGKEVVARALHERSPRAAGPFVTVAMGAIAEEALDGTLFGHARGAFAGADAARDGLFRAATRGTLFLDEVGELPPSAQAKLLRVVETKEILPLGADESVRVDARIVAATQHDLAALVAAGRFRQDLLYRLQVVTLRVPPLRERPGDVAALASWFVAYHARRQGRSARSISPEALAILGAYAWPGNVRELSNVIERAVILCTDEVIAPVDLPAELAVETQPAGPADGGADGLQLSRATLAFQRTHIASVLEKVHGNREAAARALGLSPATFYRYLQRVGLKGYQAEDARQSKSPPSSRRE